MKSLKTETVARRWGSAGAISGPPQMKSLKTETVVRRRGSAGAISGPPQMKSLVEEHPRVDVEHLPGDAVRPAERDHLIRHVLHAGRPLEHRALARAVGGLGP